MAGCLPPTTGLSSLMCLLQLWLLVLPSSMYLALECGMPLLTGKTWRCYFQSTMNLGSLLLTHGWPVASPSPLSPSVAELDRTARLFAVSQGSFFCFSCVSTTKPCFLIDWQVSPVHCSQLGNLGRPGMQGHHPQGHCPDYLSVIKRCRSQEGGRDIPALWHRSSARCRCCFCTANGPDGKLPGVCTG